MSGMVLPPDVAVAQFQFTSKGSPHGGGFVEYPCDGKAYFILLPPENADLSHWAAGTIWLPAEPVYQLLDEHGQTSGLYVCLHQGGLIE